jgi:WD40 repeat protein
VPDSSQFVTCPSLPPSNLDIFATAATDNTVSLWDLRAGAARVASFVDHVNRREKVGVAFSPCVRFLAVGSEDGVGYVYDLRNGREVVYTTSSRSRVAAEGEEEKQEGGGIGRERQCRGRRGGRAGPPPHGDVVSCVAFNPLRPELVTGSYDGGVRFHGRGE